jgi:hypothetical protein
MKPIAPLPLLAIASLLVLTGCVGASPGVIPQRAGAAHVPVPGQPSPVALSAGVGKVQGQTGSRLIAQFGAPRIDVQEGAGRKLQFAGPICILDAYLYPKGRSEATVTHIDTRQRDGKPIDPASCIAALSKR